MSAEASNWRSKRISDLPVMTEVSEGQALRVLIRAQHHLATEPATSRICFPVDIPPERTGDERDGAGRFESGTER